MSNPRGVNINGKKCHVPQAIRLPQRAVEEHSSAERIQQDFAVLDRLDFLRVHRVPEQCFGGLRAEKLPIK